MRTRCGRVVLVMVAILLGVAPALAGGATDNVGAIHREGAATLPDLFQRELAAAKAKKQGVVVMFTADWCTPCKAIKDFLAESGEVQRAVRKGRILFIDVDEWRGPAHALIPGVNPTKLPELVRVDYAGKAVVSCYGTDLGLISETAVAKNLARLIAGKAPVKPDYEGNDQKTRELILKEAQREKARVEGLAPVEVRVLSAQQADGGLTRYSLHLVLHNNDGRRRWFAVSGRLGEPLVEAPKVEGWKAQKWNEHVRAYYLQFQGTPPFAVIPVGGWGSVELNGWIVEGRTDELEVWELNRLTIDGEQAQFDKKLPYALKISSAFNSRPITTRGASKVELSPGARHRMRLEASTPTE